MIRPITVICWILALGSGLYLYRAKHEVELMDKHIEQIAKETSDIRGQSRHLLDDWIRLGQPEQLHKYSDEYLGLKTIAPTQFARLSDLPSRLPAPRADPVPDPVPEPAPADAVAQSSPAAGTDSADGTDEADTDALPLPPIPPAAPMVTQVSMEGASPVPLQARPVTPPRATTTGQPEQKPHETRAAEEPRPAAPKPTPAIVAEPRQTAPVQTPPAQIASKPHELPPLQAQSAIPAPSRPRELAPLQAQAGAPQGAAPPSGQPSYGRPVPWTVEPRVADNRREPPPRQIDPRTQTAQTGYQPQTGYRPPPAYQPPSGYQPGYQPAYPRQQAAQPMQAPAGSLLGMPRAPVPVPLPAPTPVSATWPGAGR